MATELKPREIEAIARKAGKRPPWLWAAGAGLVALVVMGLAWAFLGEAETPTAVRTVAVKVGPISSVIELSGQSAARRESNLSFNASGSTTVSGIVTDVLVEVGDQVKAGQVLATLDQRGASRSLQQASARLESERLRLAQQEAAAPSELASAQQAVASAQAQLRRSENEYVQLQSPTTQAQENAQARQQLTDAQVNLDDAQEELDAILGRSAARQQVDELTARMSELNSARLAAESALAARYADPLASTFERAVIDDLSRAIQAACRPLGDRDVCLSLASSSSDLGALAAAFAQSGLRNADSVVSAMARAEAQFPAGVEDEVRSSLFVIARAHASVDALNARINGIVQSFTEAGVPSSGDISDAVKKRDSAMESVAAAQANLNRLNAGATASQVRASQADVAAAQEALNSAQIARASKGDQQTATLDLQRRQVELAEVSEQLARDALEDTVLKAPFDGTVGSVSISTGDLASPTQTAIVLTDSSRMFVNLVVTEVDLPNLRAGQFGVVTFDALPGSTFVMRVTGVGNVGSTSQGVVTYQARGELLHGAAVDQYRSDTIALLQDRGVLAADAGPADIEAALNRLRTGTLPAPDMNANVVILHEVVPNSFLLPLTAIREQGSESYVMVLGADGQQARRVVTTGVSDGTNIAILSGLSEGEAVVLGASTTSATAVADTKGPLPGP
ncbi:MAG: efflux RND transporter periplasmic adaptor subunit [Dehalococcoidia bacterium]|nr:efflux RND transporter periplasmic adaptor subunit [Dehalococcoidia bacterium]